MLSKKTNLTQIVSPTSDSASDPLIENDRRLDELCDELKIVSNPQRLKILIYLLRGEAAVSELESVLKIKQPNLSHELRKLRDKKAVKTRRQSKVIFYSICDTRIRNIVWNINTLDGARAEQKTTTNVHKPNTITAKTAQFPHVIGECAHFPVIRE